VTFYPIGSAPRMKVSKFTVQGNLSIGELSQYVAKILKHTDDDSVHIYFQNSIELLPNQRVGDFAKIFCKFSDSAFSINVHYSIGSAYL